MSPQRSGIETNIRQLIASGKSKTALDNAKDFHKQQRNAESEILLIEAYLARIKALLDQNLAPEAKSLIALVRERFPSAKDRLDALGRTAAARGGELDELIGPLNDPGLSAERRASIEEVIQNQVTDLAALAGCAALPPDHDLRKAAAAIHQAFNAVTSGPVTDEQIALAEVSHRSPLAQWKLLIRAIAYFHRGQDKSCEEYLAAIKPESAPGRLVHAMRTMLGNTPGTKLGARPAAGSTSAGPTPAAGLTPAGLTPAEAALASRTTVSFGGLRRALANLDRSFAHDNQPGPTYKAIRAAVQECRQSEPDLLAELRRTVFMRGEVAGLDMERTIAALEGAPIRDAAFYRDLARALEHTGDSEDLMLACGWWDCFREEALNEGWFGARSLEMAALYLHMTGLLGRMPGPLLREMQHSFGKGASREDKYFFYPEELYARACLIDRHPDAFSQWLRWARKNSPIEAENVAQAWSKALPDDLEPVLYLMQQAEKSNAFPTALSYLGKAERIDAVNPTVRAARLRLLAGGALQHLQKKKTHLAAQKLAEIEALPQSRQGDRPGFLAALRVLICLTSGDQPGAEQALREAEHALGDGLTAMIFTSGCAAAAKRKGLVFLPFPSKLSEEQRLHLPVSMARAIALVGDIGITRTFKLPIEYFDETEAQFPRASGSLNVEQIRVLGELGIATEHPRLAWAASAAGLERGGPTEAYFLLLRARALPEEFDDRYEALTAAAAELGRAHGDMDVVSRAVEAGRGPFDDEPLSLSADQARDVLRKEKASPAFPSSSRPGPDYSELFSGELPSYPFDRFDIDDDPLDEEEIKRLFFEKAPEEIPRDLLPALFEVAKESLISGEAPVELLSELLGEDVPAGKNQSGAKNRPGGKNRSGAKNGSGAKTGSGAKNGSGATSGAKNGSGAKQKKGRRG